MMPLWFSPAVRQALSGPALLLVWGMAAGVLLWGSGVDVIIQLWLNENYHQDFNGAMRLLGDLGKGSTQAALCVAVAGGWWLFRRYRVRIGCRIVKNILWAVPVFALAGALNWIFKLAVGRGRPKEFLWHGTSPYEMSPLTLDAQWWSFPSGHSCSAFAIAVWLGLAFPRGRYVFWAVAVVVSLSRFLALTPHYFGDVVAGAALGSAVAWAIWNLSLLRDAQRGGGR